MGARCVAWCWGRVEIAGVCGGAGGVGMGITGIVVGRERRGGIVVVVAVAVIGHGVLFV